MAMKSSVTPWLSDDRIDEWRADSWRLFGLESPAAWRYLARMAAQFGYNIRMLECADEAKAAADAELEACCDWVMDNVDHWPNSSEKADELRAARRPESLGLKQQALNALSHLETWAEAAGADATEAVFRIEKALESIPDEQS
jgi:hypothetical protein